MKYGRETSGGTRRLQERAIIPAANFFKVYINNFLNAATQYRNRAHIPTISIALVHIINGLFLPTEVKVHNTAVSKTSFQVSYN